jgi:transposase
MKDFTAMVPEITIGLDVGDKWTHCHVLDGPGEVVETGKIRTTPTKLEDFLKRWRRARVALEVGTHSPWISRLVEVAGHECLVANAKRLRAIYENDSKDDATDAEMIARIARFDPLLLYPIQHRGAEAQADRTLLRARHALVEARSKLIQHCRSVVKSHGNRLPGCSTDTFARKTRDLIPGPLEAALRPMLDTIEQMTQKIKGMERAIDALASTKYPEAGHLATVGGVGNLTALAYVLTLEDPVRFHKSRDVGAYLGLVRKRRTSGEGDPKLGITKAGDSYLRWLLIECANYILGPHGPDSDLRRYGLRIVARGGEGAKKRARAAVARKLAVMLHRMWITGEPYQPFGYATKWRKSAAA